MEALPIFIFLVIAFNIFRSFTKTKAGASATKDIMERLNEARAAQAKAAQNQAAENQDWNFGQPKSSPWQNKSSKSTYSKRHHSKAQLEKRDSHKNPIQHGRRGKNADQNRHRRDDWGQKGDSDFLSGKGLIILLVVGAAVLYALSQITPDMLEQLGQ